MLYGILASSGALVFGLIVGAVAASTPDTAQADAAPTATATVTATKTEQAKAEPTATVIKTHKVKVTKTRTVTHRPKAKGKIPGDGTFRVGKDIKPGTYRGKPGMMGSCYWARMSDASGDMSSIIANDNIEGPTVVTINSGEYFKTNGCATWQRQ